MNDIELSKVNTRSPYSVWKEDDAYLFKTDYDIVYAVSFDQEEIRGFNTYWLILPIPVLSHHPMTKKSCRR